MTAALKALAALASCAFVATAHAQAGREGTYPSKTIRFIVPFFPGGTPDINARMIAERLRVRFNQPVIVDNRPGANGSIGMGIAAKSPPDGHTLVIATVGTWAVNPYLYKLGYDVLTDFAPIIHIVAISGVLVVHPSLPVHSVKDLIALARKRPGDLNYGASGIGGFGHLCGALFASATKVNLMFVPHKSQAAAVTDLLSGEIQLLFNIASTVVPHMRTGRLRGLGVTSSSRIEIAPELPTLAEAGVPGYENTTWNAIAAPANTPQPIVALLNREIKAIMQTPEAVNAAREQGAVVTATTPEEFHAYLRKELGKFGKLVKEAGIKADGGG
jgi:tripartite-type tricarboxylate transporter receptor subunit TctC